MVLYALVHEKTYLPASPTVKSEIDTVGQFPSDAALKVVLAALVAAAAALQISGIGWRRESSG